jgi:predicted RNA polymerase sigma factor
MTAGDLLLVRINDAAAMAMAGDLDAAIAALDALARQADSVGDTHYRDYARHNLARALLQRGGAAAAWAAISDVDLRHELSDDALILAKRASLLLDIQAALGQNAESTWARQRAVLDQTTKPHAWIYQSPWEVCDLQFWQS